MPRLPDDAKQFINSEFARRLEQGDPPYIDVVVETEPGLADEIAPEVAGFEGVTLGSVGTIAGKYIPATVPDADIADIARIPGVELVHQDQLTGVMNSSIRATEIPFLTPESDPIRQTISNLLFTAFTPQEPYVGRIGISEVEVPRFNFTQIPPGDPIKATLAAADQFSNMNVTGKKLLPTTEAVDWIRDSGLTDGAIRDDTKVSVIDTGHTPTEPENGFRSPHLESWVPGEPPADLMGHGSWCTNMTVGNVAPGVWGDVEGVAPGSQYAHFKALNTFPGFGRTSWILKSMERSIEWGADVVSMSLGGAQQGPVGEDPYCRFIRDNAKQNVGDEDGAIFVVAAGNSGPGAWTIGAPGVAPEALTVGSWSLTDNAPAVFSSRGPQGAWYMNNPDQFETDLSEYGASAFIKPDVAAPGGGRENQAKTTNSDELLFQTSTGWYDGLKDGIKDTRASMKGTSMATPAVAGLVKRLYDAGIIENSAEVKQVVAQNAEFGEFPDAAEGANETASEKNVTIGHGPIRESVFDQ